MAHRLVLPLPFDFSAAGGGVEGYSVFAHDDCGGDVHHPQLLAYIDRLAAFLHKTRCVQCHPDDFLRFFLLSDTGGEKSGGATGAVMHLDGGFTREGVAYMRELCTAFAAMGQSDGSLLDNLHVMIRDGPPAGAAECLQSFFAETRALQMNRRRRPQNDVARVVLRTEYDGPAAPSTTSSSSLRHAERTNVAPQRRCEQKMALVLGHGMSAKKQHEVSIMRDTVVDLVGCCNATLNSNTSPPLELVETVVDIGEGKGYVSRALALCDGLQVIGLECNPSHKERVVERVEFLLQNRLGADAAQKEMKGRDILNLMYEPRGHMATVSCHVGPRVEWSNVLRGHVRILDAMSPDEGVVPLNSATLREEESDSKVVSPAMGMAVENAKKLQCRFCPYIVRQEASGAIVRHARQHVLCEHASAVLGMPSKETVDEWNRELCVEAFTGRIIATFFTDRVLYTTNGDADSGLLEKRPIAEVEGVFVSPGSSRDELNDILNAFGFLADVRLFRGTRVEALLPVKQQEGEGETSAMGTVNHTYIKTCLTIVGYNCATNRHFVIRDDAGRREAFTLLRHRDGLQWIGERCADELRGPPAMDALRMQLAVLLRVLPPVLPHTPVVHAPDLRNVVMMSLHPCGNLGSNVCRLFVESASRGLLLVSCCWHALTNVGFPLSREFQKRGWRTEQLSLLLATQPLDMWTAVSAQSHRGSATLQFCRSLLKVFWCHLRDCWRSSTLDADGTPMTCCPFVEAPHLGPSFLRRIAKVKDNMTLEMLYVEVCREYFFAETGQSLDTWQHSVCSSCRVKQREFLASATNVSLAAELGREYCSKYFGSFLGLTVLRMWMSHLVETLLLLDRALYLAESLRQDTRCRGSVVSLVPLFDGAVSPRMYGILARRIPL